MKLHTLYRYNQQGSLEMLIGLVVVNRMDLRWLGVAQKDTYNALVKDIECLNEISHH